MVTGYVAGVKAACELARALKASVDATDSAQMKMQVADLISALADAKMQAAESAELITTLQRQLKTKQEMKFDGTVYYRVTEGGHHDGPYCPTCFDARGLEVRLQRDINPQTVTNWHCKECRGYFR